MATRVRGCEGKPDRKSAPQRPPKTAQPSEPMLPETLVNFATPPDFPPPYDNNLRLRQRRVLQFQRNRAPHQAPP